LLRSRFSKINFVSEDAILAIFQSQKESSSNLDDYLRYIDELHQSLNDALNSYNAHFQKSLSDLENLFSEDQLQQICDWKGSVAGLILGI